MSEHFLTPPYCRGSSAPSAAEASLIPRHRPRDRRGPEVSIVTCVTCVMRCHAVSRVTLPSSRYCVVTLLLPCLRYKT